MRYTKQQSGYKSRSKFRKCMNCGYLIYTNKCKIVIGKISQDGTSNYWRKK